MPYKFRRVCPICYKPNLLSLSHHLCHVHQLNSDERKQWLKVDKFSHQITPSLSQIIFPTGVPQGL